MQRYFSALYFYRIDLPEDERIIECIYPEWPGLHFTAEGVTTLVSLGDGAETPGSAFVATGPTSRAMHVNAGRSLTWSLGINPLGWSRFADGAASDLANAIVDGAEHPAFARLAPILELVQQGTDDFDETAKQIVAHLCDTRQTRSRHEPVIAAMYEALRDPAIGNVKALVAKIGVSRRTIERLAARYFGFPPKLLLRRQRFLRSLGRFTIDPARNWSASLDGHYVDQAHFVRDFRSFMGMTPSEYARMPHPILEGVFARRLAEQGAHSN